MTNLIRLFILVTLTLATFKTQAGELKLSDLAIEHHYSVGTNRHWSIPKGETKKGEINLHMKHENDYFYSRTKIGMMYTNRQFRYGALEYEIGGKTGRIHLGLFHRSEHTLDFEREVKYQNQNAIKLRLDLK